MSLVSWRQQHTPNLWPPMLHFDTRKLSTSDCSWSICSSGFSSSSGIMRQELQMTVLGGQCCVQVELRESSLGEEWLNFVPLFLPFQLLLDFVDSASPWSPAPTLPTLLGNKAAWLNIGTNFGGAIWCPCEPACSARGTPSVLLGTDLHA